MIGIQVETAGPGRSSGNIQVTPEEEEEFRRLASRPDVFEVISRSIAPSIYGSEDVKKAIACLLFGGSRKRYSQRRLIMLLYWTHKIPLFISLSWKKVLIQRCRILIKTYLFKNISNKSAECRYHWNSVRCLSLVGHFSWKKSR